MARKGTKGMHCTRFKKTKGGKRCVKYAKGTLAGSRHRKRR